VRRPVARAHLAKVGRALDWHGALSIDYIMPDDGGAPLLIDCNPRLVEPMNAYRSGVDLVGFLLLISLGETPAPLLASREGVLTHLAMQALLGCASRGGTRPDILRECLHLAAARGPYAGSSEELTPVQSDWISAVPLAMTAAVLLVSPKLAVKLARGGFGAHLLDATSIRVIETEGFYQRHRPA
jgi:hypothetical protein